MSAPGGAQAGIDSASHPSIAPNAGAATVTQEYAGYSSYPTSAPMPYTYAGSEYQNYYYGYQQPANVSSQQVGTNQTTGAAYQPLTSFQNSGSYVNPTSYFGSYSNAGDNQTTGYGQSSYNYQNNSWNNANAGNYAAHQYPNYGAPDANSTPTSNAVTTNSNHYQQQYSQWSYYYGQSAPVAAGATGTDHFPAASGPSAGYSAAGVGAGYSYTSPQPPPPGTTSWKNDSASSGYFTSQERVAVTTYPSNTSWQAAAPGIQNNNINQSTYYQMPYNSNPPLANSANEQNVLSSEVSTLQHSSSNQVVEHLQQPLHTVPTADVRQNSKVQIPVNPRIAPILAAGSVKTQKETSPANSGAKPAYLSVPVSKHNNKLHNQEDSQATPKGTLPASLRAYVERTFARCKDDAQRAANERIMREIINKATDDGTLISKNWDTEPLFPLPNYSSDNLEQSSTHSFVSVTLTKNKRSPNRRIKSRWEPVSEDKVVDNLPSSVDANSIKDASRIHAETSEKRGSGKSFENNANGWSGKYFSPQQQATLQKYIQKPAKRPRPSHTSNVTESGDASSDSDKEQSLTKYYASAIAIANSPEEKKRREHRFKRFEEGHGSQVHSEYFRQKSAGSGNAHNRRASAMLLARNYDDGSGVAVEDINWDALTVKGTCQEIEKRYLRLTSAPDPATVRPEDVLEKALKMVQVSAKNYLYKCDQLKSIRQDLTVQRIQNTLTVKVYETHARLALEAGDLPEYNQCQSQLKRLYAEGIEGCHLEFSAYNLLCIILHSNNKRELLSSMARLSDEAKLDEAVKHALAVRSAVSSGNYVLFFRLYKAAPNLNMCLMDLYLEKIRFEAIKCMSKSYRPSIPVVYIAEVLGFSKSLQTESRVKGVDRSEECEEWLRAHGAILTIDNSGELQLDAKGSSTSLYMPEPDDAVAHGDANLAVDDFLARAS